MAFVSRLLNITFTLGAGGATPNFAESGTNTLTLSGVRAQATILKSGGPGLNTMQLVIYGMTLSQMNQLSTLGMKLQLYQNNTVTVQAGDAQSGMGTVFIGNISNGYANLNAQPEVGFIVEAHSLGAAAAAGAPPSSYQGSADVAIVLQNLATAANLKFENNGVNIKIQNPYLWGSLRDQMFKVVKTAGIEWNRGDNGVLAIWPRNGSRGGAVPVVAPPPAGGMIGYPTFTAQGIVVRTMFDPSISIGGQIQVQSSIQPLLSTALNNPNQQAQGAGGAMQDRSSGIWAVFGLTYELATLMPGGKWEMIMQCKNPKFAGAIPAP